MAWLVILIVGVAVTLTSGFLVKQVRGESTWQLTLWVGVLVTVIGVVGILYEIASWAGEQS